MQLVRFAVIAAGFRVKHDVDYSNIHDGSLLRKIQFAVRACGGRQITVEQACGGDILLLSAAIEPEHCGILDFDGEIIHASVWMQSVQKQPLSHIQMQPCAAFQLVL